MKLAIGQINCKVGALRENTQKMLQWIERAKAEQADIIVFPELAVTGYPPMDLLDRPRFVDLNLACLDELKAASTDITVIAGFVDKNPASAGKPLFNAAAVLSEGQIKSIHHKSLLPTYDVFDEERYFEPSKSIHPVQIGDKKVGVSVCEDIWNDEDFWHRQMYTFDPIEEQANQGCDLFINISASPFYLGKLPLRQEMVANVAKKYNAPFVYVNLVGGNDSLVFDGYSFIINAEGELAWRGKGFEEDFAIIELDKLSPDSVEALPDDMGILEEALILGVKDYMGKCGFKQAVLGLSGGIDSALTCYIATKALGAENVMGISMPSQYSSQGSKDDAYLLAKNLGIDYKVIPIKDTFDSYRSSLAPTFAGREEDVTEENLQARIRGTMLMALSNKFGHLLLTTGNKSEMAVGYCTMYGDMCGGLAVISDVPKTWVFQLSKYINRNGEVIPWNTIEKPPSAELRPDQKDEDSLPPYEVLDAIIEAYVEKHKSPAEILESGFDKDMVNWVIKKININEYKRRQAPPGIKVTTKAFGQGRRYPIARGHD